MSSVGPILTTDFFQTGVLVVRSGPRFSGGFTPANLVIVDPNPINLKFKVSIADATNPKTNLLRSRT